jgi:hypothetical protein
MSSKRLPLVTFEVARELCDSCREETFRFLPIGSELLSSDCQKCGTKQTEADLSETSLFRLVTRGSGRLLITQPSEESRPN